MFDKAGCLKGESCTYSYKKRVCDAYRARRATGKEAEKEAEKEAGKKAKKN
jgi:hypothetical protein